MVEIASFLAEVLGGVREPIWKAHTAACVNEWTHAWVVREADGKYRSMCNLAGFQRGDCGKCPRAQRALNRVSTSIRSRSHVLLLRSFALNFKEISNMHRTSFRLQ